jgi:hypothetical protein
MQASLVRVVLHWSGITSLLGQDDLVIMSFRRRHGMKAIQVQSRLLKQLAKPTRRDEQALRYNIGSNILSPLH